MRTWEEGRSSTTTGWSSRGVESEEIKRRTEAVGISPDEATGPSRTNSTTSGLLAGYPSARIAVAHALHSSSGWTAEIEPAGTNRSSSVHGHPSVAELDASLVGIIKEAGWALPAARRADDLDPEILARIARLSEAGVVHLFADEAIYPPPHLRHALDGVKRAGKGLAGDTRTLENRPDHEHLRLRHAPHTGRLFQALLRALFAKISGQIISGQIISGQMGIRLFGAKTKPRHLRGFFVRARQDSNLRPSDS
jgi:hypothetical protein